MGLKKWFPAAAAAGGSKKYFRSHPKPIKLETLEGGGVFLIPVQTQVCVRFGFFFFFCAVIKHQGILQKKGLIWAFSSSQVRVHCGGEAEQQEAESRKLVSSRASVKQRK